MMDAAYTTLLSPCSSCGGHRDFLFVIFIFFIIFFRLCARVTLCQWGFQAFDDSLTCSKTHVEEDDEIEEDLEMLEEDLLEAAEEPLDLIMENGVVAATTSMRSFPREE